MQKALDSVSFKVEPGEVVGLLGPNGAGKSTIMKILTCFIPPTSGNANVCGFDVLDQSIEVRRKVGYLPENNPLYLDLYVKELLMFIDGIRQPMAVGHWPLAKNKSIGAKSQKPKAKSQKRIAEIINLTGLGSEQHKKIGALSKGYRQRVGLAQALLHDPQVLILDEPTSGLDPNQLLEIRSLIKEIGKEKTVMLSTHIMQEVEAICSRAIIIHKGKIVADDSTSNLQHIASSRIIIHVEFGSAVQQEHLLMIKGALDARPLSSPDPAGKSTRWEIVSDAASDIRPDIFKYAVDNDLTVLSLHKEEQKLEEVFQELTKN